MQPFCIIQYIVFELSDLGLELFYFAGVEPRTLYIITSRQPVHLAKN